MTAPNLAAPVGEDKCKACGGTLFIDGKPCTVCVSEPMKRTLEEYVPDTREWEEEAHRLISKVCCDGQYVNESIDFITTLLFAEREKFSGGASEIFDNGRKFERAKIEDAVGKLKAEKMFGENIQWDDGWKAALDAVLKIIRGDI